MIDLRLGDWREALADVESVDALISDPPYGARIHNGQRHGRRKVSRDSERWCTSRGLGYTYLSPKDVREFVAAWAPRVRGWFCVMTSHDLVPHWEHALRKQGRYVFRPLPCIMRGMNVRLAGDGPSSWSVELVVSKGRYVSRPIIVSRPSCKPYSKWGTLPGAYTGKQDQDGKAGRKFNLDPTIVGAKPIWLMRAIVRDYTKPGDLIVDPCAGGGTTLLAAAIEGRKAVGAEIDPDTYAIAKARLAAGWTPDMFSGVG